jgi:hypothetical protein
MRADRIDKTKKRINKTKKNGAQRLLTGAVG